eukprot:Opistho-1_new@23982
MPISCMAEASAKNGETRLWEIRARPRRNASAPRRRHTGPALLLAERQPGTQARKRRREAVPQPPLHARRVDDALAEGMGHQAINHEDDESHRHEHRAQQQQLQQRRPGAGTRLHELRQEGEEENGELGVEDVQQESLRHQARRRGARRSGVAVHCEGRGVAPGGVGHVEQVGHAGELEHLEGQRAGVHHRGQAQHGGQQVRHDTGRAAQRRVDAGAAALREPGRHRVENPGARDEHHDERGDEELDADHEDGSRSLWRLLLEYQRSLPFGADPRHAVAGHADRVALPDGKVGGRGGELVALELPSGLGVELLLGALVFFIAAAAARVQPGGAVGMDLADDLCSAGALHVW